MRRAAVGGLALICLGAGLVMGMALGHPVRAATATSAAAWHAIGATNGYLYVLDESGRKLRVCYVVGAPNVSAACSGVLQIDR
jgi:hypothetical protein